MADAEFYNRVAETVVNDMERMVDAILQQFPLPPGVQEVHSFRDFLAEWGKMPIEKRRQVFQQMMSQEQRDRLIEERGQAQVMQDLGMGDVTRMDAEGV